MKRLHIADRVNIIPATIAREKKMVCVETIDKETGEVTDTMGNIGRITAWLGANGEPCSPSVAAVAIAHCGCNWFAIDLRQYHAITVH